MGEGHRQRSRLTDAILGASTGLCHGGSVFLLAFFHPASRVAVAEAFLARRVGVVHLLSQDEEPAQRPQEAPDGTFWSWVRDVGFWHSVVSLPLPQATGAYSTRCRSDGAMRGCEGESSSAPLTVW